MARNNEPRTSPGSPAAAGGELVREGKTSRLAEEALTRCGYCGKLPTPIHWRCGRCGRIACARCLVAPVTFEWLCPDCRALLAGGYPGSRQGC